MNRKLQNQIIFNGIMPKRDSLKKVLDLINSAVTDDLQHYLQDDVCAGFPTKNVRCKVHITLDMKEPE